MTRALTRLEIMARIVPEKAEWPSDLASWRILNEAVDALHNMVSAVEANVANIEANADLNPDGMARQRREIGEKALLELQAFALLRKAEKAVEENIEYLTRNMTNMPSPSTAPLDIAIEQEVRALVRSNSNPAAFALGHLHDGRIMGAVLNAPSVLSGMTDEQVMHLREHAADTLHPEQSQMRKRLQKAISDLRSGIESARRAIRMRCGI